jgi:membrane-bound serine protease (ClpP class)
MDTYGGELSAATDMLEALLGTSIPTITYINTNAGSAGALVALSTRRIYMAPVSAIGAAAPVTSSGQDLPSTMEDKVVSYFSGYFRSAADTTPISPRPSSRRTPK